MRRILGIRPDREMYARYQRLRDLDEGFAQPDELERQLRAEVLPGLGAPRVLCSFHYGLYKTLVYVLARNHVPLCIPVTAEVYRNRREWFARGYAELGEQHVTFVNIESRSGFAKLLPMYKSGYNILFFPDGNSSIHGMGGTSRHDREQTFLSTSLHVPQGIPWLVARTQAAVQILTSTYSFDTASVRLHAHTLSGLTTTGELWSILEELIRQDGLQWEGWQYVNLFENQPPPLPPIPPFETKAYYGFNSELWDLYSVEGQRYLMQLDRIESIRISPALHTQLAHQATHGKRLLSSELCQWYGSQTLAEDLVKQSILIPLG